MVAEIKDKFKKMIENIRNNIMIDQLDEAATKQTVVLRILNHLDWQTYSINEVYPEYSLGGRKVDYSLRHNNNNKVFIEVKKMSEDLEKHQQQLLEYAFQEGVKLAVLTNGISWWFYLPLHEGSWHQRKFYTIDINVQNPDEISQKFIDFLLKQYIVEGQAVKNAETILTSKQKDKKINDAIPKAWEKLLEEPDEALLEILLDATEKVCGHKPDYDKVVLFLNSKFKKEEEINKTIGIVKLKHNMKNVPDAKQKTLSSLGKKEIYTGKAINSFIFRDNKYEVDNWRGLLHQIVSIMLDNHLKEFEKILDLRGRERPFFSKNADELRAPTKIENTDIYVEVHLSAMAIVNLSYKIISLFGYKKSDLTINAK